MERKVIFLDIDGTLTEPGSNTPPKSALEAIARARANGHYVFLCSGRNYDMLSPLLKYEFDGVVASSGGYIVCGGKVIYDCPMTEDQKERMLKILRENGVFCTVECLDGSFTDEGFKEFLRQRAKEGGNSELLRWREQIEKSLNILPMKEYKGQPVYKIVVMCQSMDQLEAPRKALEGEFLFCIQDEGREGLVNGEIVNRKFDKGQGIERVCACLGLPLQASVAFGDSMNDREMMEKAGLGICMENGSPLLKAMADDVCPSVSEDGLLEGFRKHHLI